jgi:hypothetical protein
MATGLVEPRRGIGCWPCRGSEVFARSRRLTPDWVMCQISRVFLAKRRQPHGGTLGCGTLLSKIRMEAYPVAEFRIGERPQIEDDLVHEP